MLKIYVYCSYRKSPDEFTLGAFNAEKLNDDEEFIYITKEEASNKIIAELFYSGEIKRAYGKLPEDAEYSGSYIYLIKELKCEFMNEDNMPSIKYGNFAFETDDPELYRKIFFNIKRMAPQKLNKYLDLMLIPDVYVPDFRSKLCSEEVKNFCKDLTQETEGDRKDDLCIISSSDQADYSGDIAKIIGCPVERYKENRYRIKKKMKFYPVIFLILLISLIMFLIIVETR